MANAPRNRSDRWLLAYALFMFTASCTLLGAYQAKDSQATDDEEFYRFMDVAAEIYNEVRDKYVEPVEAKEVLEAGLRGMFMVLDDHSQYLPPQYLEDLEKDTGKEYGGLGIHITMRQGLLTVIAPMPGSPAARAGMQPWDRIVEISGESTQGWGTRQAIEKLMGPPGTKVMLKVWREGLEEPVDMEVTRANIRIETVHYEMKENKTGYVRVSKFAENTTNDLRKALNDLKSQGMESLILDLRFNTGGLLREAILMSDLFLEKGQVIVSTKGRRRSQSREESAREDPLVRVPMFVLVNGSSASASEIVAGALQDHKVAMIVGPSGVNTYGKGSVQTIEDLAGSLHTDANGNPRPSAIRLTTARYYTPSGRTIHGLGITPDIGIPIPAAHEAEVLEHGLLGDPPQPQVIPEEEGIEGSDQKEKPFYSHARTPNFRNEEYRDILLSEAIEQLKVYRQMFSPGKEGRTVVAKPVGEGGRSVVQP